MSQSQFVGVIGKIWIPCSFSVGILILVLHWLGKYDETTAAVAEGILSPLLLSFAWPIFQTFLSDRNKTMQGHKVNRNFVFVGISVPVFFTGYLFLIIIKQAFRPDTLGTFIHYLESGEAVFGIYMGALCTALFKENRGEEIE